MRGVTQKSGRPTLNDIATLAGVSVSTVSLVLSDKAKQRRLSDAAIARIRDIAAELDYSPNLLVKSLQHGRTHTISFFNGFRTRRPDDLYMDRLSTAIEQAGGRLGYDILVYCVFNRSVEDTYRYLNGGRCDGLVFFAPGQEDPLMPYLRTSRLPTVLINAVDQHSMLSSVKEDHVTGLSQVADRLIALGHRRIAVFSNVPGRNPDADQRVLSLRERLASRGVSIPNRWVINTDDNRHQEAEAGLSFLMAEPEPPTAIFCWHDRLGYQVLECCDRMGISVPDELSLIGYDGLRWPAQSRHLLASVHVDLTALAEDAIVLLDTQIQGRATTPAASILPVSVMSGTTLARCRSGKSLPGRKRDMQ